MTTDRASPARSVPRSGRAQLRLAGDLGAALRGSEEYDYDDEYDSSHGPPPSSDVRPGVWSESTTWHCRGPAYSLGWPRSGAGLTANGRLL